MSQVCCSTPLVTSAVWICGFCFERRCKGDGRELFARELHVGGRLGTLIFASPRFGCMTDGATRRFRFVGLKISCRVGSCATLARSWPLTTVPFLLVRSNSDAALLARSCFHPFCRGLVFRTFQSGNLHVPLVGAWIRV